MNRRARDGVLEYSNNDLIPEAVQVFDVLCMGGPGYRSKLDICPSGG